MDFKSFIAATRTPFVAASILPVLFTTAYVRETGIDYLLFSLVIIAVFFLHLSANVINDFIDWENDGVNENAGRFNGGTRQFVENIVGREQYKIMFNIAMLIGIACVVTISYFRPYAIIPGIVGIMIAYYYSSPPLNLQSRGLGEFVLFLVFGPVLTFGTGYVLTDTLSLNHFLIGIPPGLLTTLILWINQFPDYEADKKAGKKNLVVRLGLEKSFNIFMLGQMLVYISIVFLIITGILPIIAFFLFILAPFSFYIVKQAKINLNNPKMLESAQEKTIMLQNVALIAMIVIMFF